MTYFITSGTAFFVSLSTMGVLIILHILCFMDDASSDITCDKTCKA